MEKTIATLTTKMGGRPISGTTAGMLRNFLGLAVLVLSVAWPVVSAANPSPVTVMRKQAQMRKGPASYYEVTAVIPENTRLTPAESVMGWLKVEYDGKGGFISAKVTQPSTAKEDVFSKMAAQVVDKDLSRHGMSAGAKGFASRFSKQIKGDAAVGGKIAEFHLDPAAHAAFAASTYHNVSANQFRSRLALPTGGIRTAYTSVEQGLGVSIAGKIGALKLVQDPGLTQYVNHVGQLVVAASSGYDLPFAFFIIDAPESVNAYACPGGYVFVTLGLLKHIKDEAELAAVLAHEVAHVTRQHGLKEISKRKAMIVAEDAFAELDAATGSVDDDKWKAIEDDLDQFALNAYETIFEGRLADYELEADRIGLIYTARSGYDPNAMVVMLRRLKQAGTVSTNEHYTSQQIDQRLKGIKAAVKSIPANSKYFRYTERWRKNTAMLRLASKEGEPQPAEETDKSGW